MPGVSPTTDGAPLLDEGVRSINDSARASPVDQLLEDDNGRHDIVERWHRAEDHPGYGIVVAPKRHSHRVTRHEGKRAWDGVHKIVVRAVEEHPRVARAVDAQIVVGERTLGDF